MSTSIRAERGDARRILGSSVRQRAAWQRQPRAEVTWTRVRCAMSSPRFAWSRRRRLLRRWRDALRTPPSRPSRHDPRGEADKARDDVACASLSRGGLGPAGRQSVGPRGGVRHADLQCRAPGVVRAGPARPAELVRRFLVIAAGPPAHAVRGARTDGAALAVGVGDAGAGHAAVAKVAILGEVLVICAIGAIHWGTDQVCARVERDEEDGRKRRRGEESALHRGSSVSEPSGWRRPAGLPACIRATRPTAPSNGRRFSFHGIRCSSAQRQRRRCRRWQSRPVPKAAREPPNPALQPTGTRSCTGLRPALAQE